MAPINTLDHLSNPLAIVEQLQRSATLSEESKQMEDSIHFVCAQLTQAAGVLLRLPQEVIAQSIVLLTRSSLGSPLSEDLSGLKRSSSASVYLAAKLSFTPVSPRSVCNVYGYLLSPIASPLWFINRDGSSGKDVDPRSYYVSDGTYQSERLHIFEEETKILKRLGFNTHVALPHTLLLTYMQTLGVLSPALVEQALGHLNAALLSPQLLYLTHQPNELAVAAIYLAAKETDVKMVNQDWWEVFDVDREALGFLVLAFQSMAQYAKTTKSVWERLQQGKVEEKGTNGTAGVR